MAKQIAGLCFLEGTIDDLTFYKMDGQYYCRAKSCLTSERVKTSPRFRLTMLSARRLARASKIGATIYKALPPRWRQFWMYRSFTGEAFTLLKHTTLSEAAIAAQLHACYVDCWEKRRAADPDNVFWQPVPVKIRKRRKYSAESLQRRWEAMRAKRPRKEIREEKRLEEEARREAWKEKLALRDAVRAAAAKVLAVNEAWGQEAGDYGDVSNQHLAVTAEYGALHPTEHPPGQPGAIVNLAAVNKVTPRKARPVSADLKPIIVLPRTVARRHKRYSAKRPQWHIHRQCMLQKQSVPAVTRKRRTDTLTIFTGRLRATATCHLYDSS